MPIRSLSRKAVLLLLLAILAAPWASRAEPRREAPRRFAASASAPAPLRLLGELWSRLTSTWGEEGCNIDPSGRCVASPASGLTPPADEGCRLDPSGCRR